MKNENDTKNESIIIENSVDKEELNKINNIKSISVEVDNKSINVQTSEDVNEEKKDGEYLASKNNSPIFSYYFKTVKYLQNSHEYRNTYSMMLNSKNYIPKNYNNLFYRNNFKGNYNDKYINNYQQINNCIYDLNNHFFFKNENENNVNINIKPYNYNNFNINKGFTCNNLVDKKINNINVNINSSEGDIKKDQKGYFDNSASLNTIVNDLDCLSFIPSNYNNQKESIIKDYSRKESNDSLSKDKESDSTSAISEKREEENNFNSFNNKTETDKNKINEKNLEESEYLVEMFGRKGWICRLCNNFNYETRNKCNRCGIVKKPKKIIDIKQKVDPKANKETKERNNKKGDWICLNCRNLNYSFRTICNRCKIPKINTFINGQNILKRKEINNMQKYPIYPFPPYFIIFNNIDQV